MPLMPHQQHLPHPASLPADFPAAAEAAHPAAANAAVVLVVSELPS